MPSKQKNPGMSFLDHSSNPSWAGRTGRFSFWNFSSTIPPSGAQLILSGEQGRGKFQEFASRKSPRLTPAAGNIQGIGIRAWSSVLAAHQQLFGCLGGLQKSTVEPKLPKFREKAAPESRECCPTVQELRKNTAFLGILWLGYPGNGDFRDKNNSLERFPATTKLNLSPASP